MSDKIWMISATWYDEDAGDTRWGIKPEHGYFTSGVEAETKAKNLNDVALAKYEAEMREVQRLDEVALQNWKRALNDARILRDATGRHISDPYKPSPTKLTPFKVWVEEEGHHVFSSVEIEMGVLP